MKLMLSILFVCTTTLLSAQSSYQNITEKRIAFLSSKVHFTADEAQLFWPVFREYHQKREAITGRRKDIRNAQPGLSDQDYLNIVNGYIDTKVQQAKLLEEYNKKYLQILPAKKVLELYKFDEEFNKYLLKQIKEKGNKKSK